VPRISPFVGLRFDPARVGSLERLTAPPYDVISGEEHARLLAASPYNVIRLDLGRDPGEAHTLARYERAGVDLAEWRRTGVFVPTAGERYFPYEMSFALHGRRRRVRGVIAAVELEAWGGDIVPHERTMPGPVEDRLRLTRALGANLSSIYAILRGPCAALAGWLDRETDRAPDARLVDEAGVEHRLWEAPPEPDLAGWLEPEPLMIADGHHRYATALRYREERRAERGPGAWDAAMMLLVDGALDDPPVLPFHRIQLAGDPPTQGTRVRDLEEVLETLEDEKLTYGIATREGGALVHRVAELDGAPPTVCRLHEGALSELDDALAFTQDAVVAEEAVRSRGAVAAYLLPPTDATTIRSVVEGGGRLPRKSTFFWPKPRTGLVLRPHDLG
jgi:uncharacterized protein (DUF1015 family)